MNNKILYIRSHLVKYIIHTCHILYFYSLNLLISKRTISFQNVSGFTIFIIIIISITVIFWTVYVLHILFVY